MDDVNYDYDMFYDADDGEFRERYECEDNVFDAIWDDFDQDSWIEDTYSAEGLWREICNHSVEYIEECMRDSANDQARDEFDDAVGGADDNDEFECYGTTYYRLRRADIYL